MKTPRLLAVAVVAVIGVLALAAVALAKPGLDPNYGQNGVAAIATVAVPGYPLHEVSEFAAARDGSVYTLVSAYNYDENCGSNCSRYYLERIGATGTPEASFNGGAPLELPPTAAGYRIAVDAKGRVIAAGLGGNTVAVYRFDLAGNLEGWYGNLGTALVSCACEPATVRIVPAGGERVLVVGSTGEAGQGVSGRRVSLTRLLATGKPDPEFGSGGTTGYSLHAVGPPKLLAVTGKGAILLGSENCCAADLDTVVRVSAAGKLDTRFNRTARRSLRRLNALGEVRSVASLLLRPNGTIDLLGSRALVSGFDLRLRANGRLTGGFGKNGLVGLPLRVASAAIGSGGAIFAASPEARAFRILASGRLDPSFSGSKGLGSGTSGSGIKVGIQNSGRAVLMNIGYHAGRYEVPSTPAIARFIEVAKR